MLSEYVSFVFIFAKYSVCLLYTATRLFRHTIALDEQKCMHTQEVNAPLFKVIINGDEEFLGSSLRHE